MRRGVLLVVISLSLSVVVIGQEGTMAPQTGALANNLATTKQPGTDDSQTRKPTILAALDDGVRLFKSRDFKAAAAIFESVSAADPSLFLAAYDLGVASLELNDFPVALRAMKQAVLLRDDSARAWQYLGYAYGKLQDRDRAMSCYLKALTIEPEMVSANNNLGIEYMALNRYDQAEMAFRRVLKVNENYQSAIEGMCFASSMLGHLEDATDYCGKAKALDEDNWLVNYFVGCAYTDGGRLKEALAQLNEALRKQPRRAEIFVALGLAYRKMGRLSEALKNCQQAIELSPNYGPAYEGLAGALFAARRYQEAKQPLSTALSLNPQSDGAHYTLAVTCLALGQRDCALEQYHILQSSSPEMTSRLGEQLFGSKVVRVSQH